MHVSNHDENLSPLNFKGLLLKQETISLAQFQFAFLGPRYIQSITHTLQHRYNFSQDMTWGHRTRIKTEEKAKVVACVWEEEFIKFLAPPAILSRTILKNRKNSSFSFKSSWRNSSYYSKSS